MANRNLRPFWLMKISTKLPIFSFNFFLSIVEAFFCIFSTGYGAELQKNLIEWCVTMNMFGFTSRQPGKYDLKGLNHNKYDLKPLIYNQLWPKNNKLYN